jgi:hypothetical protein
VGIIFPSIPCPRVTPRVAPPLIFHQNIEVDLPKHYFIGRSKKGVHKNLQIKIRKNYRLMQLAGGNLTH